ncbi:disintegrin and metalloproteinase domain-containing protein 15 isoform 2-T2 [Discoglossus pictus]
MRLAGCGLLVLLCGLVAGTERLTDTGTQTDTIPGLTARTYLPGDTGARPRPGEEQRPEADPQLRKVTPYWEIIPEIHKDGHRLSVEEVVQRLPSRLQLSLEIEGTPVHMELQHSSHLLPESYHVTYYLPNGTRVTEENTGLVNCYYQGKVLGQAGSWSSLNLCSGLSGDIILSTDRRYTIEPIPGDLSHKHILRPSQDTLPRNLTCKTGEAAHERTENPRIGQRQPTVHRRRKRDVINEMKYVEMVMVADNSEFKMLNEDLKKLQIRMLEIANKMDAFYHPLNIRVALVAVEVWSQKDEILVSTNPGETLTRFLAWREKKLLTRVAHDNAQLLTGVTFTGSSVGMATINSMCSADRSGGVNVDHSVSIQAVASTIAHELGHNLGLTHDTPARNCGQPEKGRNWIMEPSGGFMPGLVFSNCSLSDLASSLQQGGAKCLYNVPAPRTLFGEPRCGNMLVEEGEQCDCGLALECTDTCCNASSCQLFEGAECSSSDLCCDQCKLKPLGSMCRESLGECDLPEFCNGVSSQCPENVFFQNGEPCAKGQAKCYQGQCWTLQTQCQKIWGPDSSPAHDTCFSKMNMRGDKYGNCGRRPNGSYLPCAETDTFCGKIQCQVGAARSLVGSDVEILTVNTTVDGAAMSCWGTSFNLGDDVWDPALVMTGMLCGAGKVCIKQRCQDEASLIVQSCKNKCNGHGVCNSNNNCHCEAGWSPPDCGSAGQGGSIDSGPLALEKAGSALTTALLLTFLLFIPLLVLLAFCYVKRDVLQRRLGNFSKGSSCQYRVTQTDNRTRPLRPPPPHRAQSTELQVMSANSQESDRPDPPSKPLPPDPVQKHCQADAQNRPPPPTRPLPVDPLPRRAQATSSGKPPLPRKPLPLVPLLQREDAAISVPTYPDHIIALPSRPAPPPPDAARTPHV